MTPRTPDPSFSLWQLVAFDGIFVAGAVALHASLSKEVPVGITIAEFLAFGAVGTACAYFWWRTGNRAAERAPAPDTAKVEAELQALRKDTAENLRLLQEDLDNLGQAIMKRLSHKAEAKPESEHFEALAGTVTDLAVSIAEARETLTGIAADLAETKSTVFELQAQADQQVDALRAFEHSVEKTQLVAEPADAGLGAAPGALAKALAAGVAGAAVSRLIGSATPARPATPTPGDTQPEFSPPPLASEDLEGAFDADDDVNGDDFAGDSLPEEDWEEATVEDAAPKMPATGVQTTAEEQSEEVLIEAEETDDWLSCGLDEEEEQPDTAAKTPAAASQPDLLPLDEESDSKKKPRRPGKHDTALVAHVMIGIGNKPFLRGFGPGLSPDKGVPMEYVDVGRWQWVCPEAGSPVTVTLWRNDETPAEGAPVSVPSGMTLEIHPLFPH